MTNTAYLLTGTNIGERESHLTTARQYIGAECGPVVHASSIYETAAWGKTDQPAFLNQALEIHTSLDAHQLMRQILKLEKKMGRVRQEKYGPRIIDIDILLVNGQIIKDPLVTVPHPEMQNRRFVLMPLTEIASAVLHPVFKKPIKQLLDECPDQLPVNKYS